MTVNYLNIIISKLGPYSKVMFFIYTFRFLCRLTIALIGATMSAHLMEAGKFTSIGLFALAGTLTH